jgi:hypothetical protein
MTLEDLEGKRVFSEGFVSICGIFEWLKALARKNGAPVMFGKFSGVFCGFFGYFKWLGHNHNYFLETEGPAAILPTSRDRG